MNTLVELVKMEAIAKKREFSNALGVTSVFWNHIEARRNNFPKDEMKRFNAAKNLQATFKVSMEYLLAGTGSMFIGQPERRTDEMGVRATGLDFRDKAQKRGLLEELEAARREILALKAENEDLRNRLKPSASAG